MQFKPVLFMSQLNFNDQVFRSTKMTAISFSFPRYLIVNLTLLLQKIILFIF